MKISFSLFLALSVILSGATGAFAGSFGGPGPFRNGSPLPTGTDGTYNASFQGENLSGVFRFSINSGTQQGDVVLPPMELINPPGEGVGSTGQASGELFLPIYSSRNNVWIAWYEGIAYRGLTDAMISEGNVSGVLDVMKAPQAQANQPTTPITGTKTTTNTLTQVFTPFVSPVTGDTTITTTTTTVPVTLPSGINSSLMDGEFQGKLNQNSPYGAIKGKGKFTAIINSGLNNSDLSYLTSAEQFSIRDVSFRFNGSRVFSGDSQVTTSSQ